MNSADDIREELRGPANDLRREIPDVMSAYAHMAQAATADGELSTQTKELAALAIAITRECDGCIVAHVRNLVRLRTTRREIAELAGVAIMMNGGPGTVWGPRALAAYDQVVADHPDATGSPKT
jgi:AhpD family alkylhydroperoxidase